MQNQIIRENGRTVLHRLITWFLELTYRAGSRHLLKNIENKKYGNPWIKNLVLEMNFGKSVQSKICKVYKYQEIPGKKKNLLQFLKEQGEPETRLHNTQGIQSRWFLSLSGCGVPSRKENLKDGMWAQWIQMIGLFKVLLSLKL